MKKVLQIIKDYVKLFESLLNDIYYNIAWVFCNKGLNNQIKEEKIIVSLTSFPGRIYIVHKTIKTILLQKKIKPDSIELWLAYDQFPQKKLPTSLTKLKKYGLKILWTEDIKSYKKLIPALSAHPNDVIVTADDDVYYKRDWLSKLYHSYLKDPQNIHCHRATQFIVKNQRLIAISGGKSYYREPSFRNKLVGIGGVLYPRHSFNKLIFDKRLFMQIAPTNDDIWFWFMAILNNKKIYVVEGNYRRPVDVWGTQKTSKLTTVNDHGDELFWSQLNALLDYFPEIKNILFS